MPNRLAGATSPYLLQHSDNPVDWWPWGSEAFAEAKRRQVPVFLSVGYAACHWCHVMAHESFEDPATAVLLNERFVSIKVDREERPDVDAVYMNVTQAMTGSGGWPMSVFLTPDGDPFHAGTYFPPERRPGMPSFTDVLDAVHEAWTERREQIVTGAPQITEELSSRLAQTPEAATADPAESIAKLKQGFDPRHGGFGGAPKFPPSMVITGLLRAAERPSAYPDAWPLASATLRAMAEGGIHDQLAGGFARYSVDAAWIVPHFEKMLYDNAILLGGYTRAAVLAPRFGEDPEPYERVVTGIVTWLLDEMRTPEGGFAASLDADSLVVDADGSTHAHEGAFYVWTPAQLAEVLGDHDGASAAQVLGVTDEGTFEHGRSTLRGLGELPEPWRIRLLEARRTRPAPARDDKIVAAWNGWMIDVLARAAMIMDRPDWLDAAQHALTLLRTVHADPSTGRLARTSRDGVASTAPGLAEDHAAVALAAVTVACATGDADTLAWAGELLRVLREDFAADDGGLMDTAADAEQLIMRPRELSDNATPSGSATAVAAARAYGRVTGDAARLAFADQVAATLTPLLAAAPRFAGWALADTLAQQATAAGTGPVEVAITGPTTAERDALIRLAWRESPDGSVVVAGAPGAPGWELLADRPARDGQPTAYVCRGFVCELPLTDADTVRERLVR